MHSGKARSGHGPGRQPLASVTLISDPSLPQMYHKHSPHFTVETNNAQQLVGAAAGNIEKLLAKRSEALKVSVAMGEKKIILSSFLSKFEIQMEIRSSERTGSRDAASGRRADTIRADILQPADLI